MSPRRRPLNPPPRPKPLGPTPEAMAHGDYVLPESPGALQVYTNRRSNYFARLRAHGAITPRQYAAGIAFEATHARAWGCLSPSKDSTVFGIGGTVHETEAQADRIVKAKARLNTILNRVGPMRYALLRQVCVWGESLGAVKGAGKQKALVLRGALCDALDECVVVYGIEEQAA